MLLMKSHELCAWTTSVPGTSFVFIAASIEYICISLKIWMLWTFRSGALYSGMQPLKAQNRELGGFASAIFSIVSYVIRAWENTKNGYKEAVRAASLSLYDAGVVFVVPHLAAHDAKRVEDYDQIIDNHHYKPRIYRNIFDRNFVFWFGDLNFRLDSTDTLTNQTNKQ
uniref:Inositol polyphosphate-related phosphatase domain-containing protein n=1 Tax=Glossina palpalis gambiensis TaxID=67801 RepID=A0A1B0BG89_9MUSC